MKKSEWKKHQDMEGAGKGDGHQHERKPGILQSEFQQPGNSGCEEVRGRWTPTGAEPKEQWMDGRTDGRTNGWMDGWMDG